MPVGSPEEYVQNYAHQHVLRDLLTVPTGSNILNVSTSIRPGV